MSQIGIKEAEPFNDLNNIINEILTSARILARLWAIEKLKSEDEWKKHGQEIIKNEAIFWDSLDESDIINKKINTLINTIENTCKSIISEDKSLFSILNKKIF